jgi:hypothetical protein
MTTTTVSWTAAPVAEQVTLYKVAQSTNGGSFSPVGEVTEPEIDFVDLAPGAYKWKVSAVNLAGESPQSAEVDGPALPSAPVGLMVEVIVS